MFVLMLPLSMLDVIVRKANIQLVKSKRCISNGDDSDYHL